MEEQLKEVKRMEQQRNDLITKLQKIEEKRDTVKPEVFEKVKQDYQKKIDQVTGELLRKRDVLESEFKTVEKEKKELSTKKVAIDMDIEELELRYSIGEYDDETFKKLSREMQHKLAEIEKHLKSTDDRTGWMKDLLTMEKKGVDEEVTVTEKRIEEKIEERVEPKVEEEEKVEEEVVEEKVVVPEKVAEEKTPALEEIIAEIREPEETAEAVEKEVKEETVLLDDMLKEGKEAKEETKAVPEKEIEIEEHILSKTEAFRETPKKIVCPKCGFANNPDSWYCEKCGAEILQESDK